MSPEEIIAVLEASLQTETQARLKDKELIERLQASNRDAERNARNQQDNARSLGFDIAKIVGHDVRSEDGDALRDAVKAVVRQRDGLLERVRILEKANAEAQTEFLKELAARKKAEAQRDEERASDTESMAMYRRARARAEILEKERDDVREHGRQLLSEFEALKQQAKNRKLEKEWVIQRIDKELQEQGLELLWTDGGGSACPTGWHRNPYINSGRLQIAESTAKRLEAELDEVRKEMKSLREQIETLKPKNKPGSGL